MREKGKSAMNERECARFLSERDGFLLITHRSPDGDTVGSAAALCLALRSIGKRASLLANAQITARYAELAEGLTVTEAEGLLPVFVDVAAPDMCQSEAEGLSPALVIDHHAGERFAGVPSLRDATAAAAGEIVFRLLAPLGVKLTEEIARRLYVAIATDTGCFRYGNTTAETHRIASELLSFDIGMEGLNRALFEVRSRTAIAVEREALNGMRFYGEGRIAVISLSAEMRTRLCVQEDDVDAISSLPRTVEGVDVGVTLKEQPTVPGEWKISLRTTPAADASAICATFGGGGHARAAGCLLHGSAEEVEAQVIAACLAALGGEGV